MRSLVGVRGRQVSCGEDHTCLLDSEGGLWTWGRGTWGQTGHGHCENRSLPQRMAALAGRRLVQVAAGGRHTLALDASNQLWAWGNNESGQLGAPPSASQPAPQPVRGLPAGCPVLFVAAGGDHSLAVVDRHASLADTAVGELGACCS